MNCLQKFDKSILLPKVVYESTSAVGGYYVRPWAGERLIGGRYHAADRGIIVISSLWPEQEKSTLFHEYRHHWQRHNITRSDFPYWPFNQTEDYDADIARYFGVWWERDALEFEHLHAPTDLTDYWLSLLEK